PMTNPALSARPNHLSAPGPSPHSLAPDPPPATHHSDYQTTRPGDYPTKHTWTKFPNFICAAVPTMSRAEFQCTFALVRQTYGYHRESTRLTYDDFHHLTGIKGKATIASGLKAVIERGFFKRAAGRSKWVISSDSEPNDASNRSEIEPTSTINSSKTEPNLPPNSSKIEPNKAPNSSDFEPFQYNKERRSPAGKERERERKPAPPATPHSPPATRHSSRFPAPRSLKERELLKHPGAMAWLELDLPWPGWQRLELISHCLGPKPQADALRKARDLWLLSGYKPSNMRGILDWYEQICLDDQWRPYGQNAGKGVRGQPGSLNGNRQDKNKEAIRQAMADLQAQRGVEA
ncbi:MAG: hypothetical protein GWP61_22710, partial [Chloroflexi bacterium]|nr:hypothetical protein [Chloroflexota bacterium]